MPFWNDTAFSWPLGRISQNLEEKKIKEEKEKLLSKFLATLGNIHLPECKFTSKKSVALCLNPDYY